MRDHAADYSLENKLGEGSFGVVYKAYRKRDGKVCAIKRIHLDASDEEAIDVMREISVMKLSRSDYIVKYYDSFIHKRDLWIVMEYMNGGSVANLLKIMTLSEPLIAYICKCMLKGLISMHDDQKIHRDIKGGNVLLTRDGHVKLADFGVSSRFEDSMEDRAWAGTPFWMAPEVIDQIGHDGRADIWSLGITAIEMANGKPPGAGKHPLKVMEEVSKGRPPRIGDNYSSAFQDFVSRALTKDYNLRMHAKNLVHHEFLQNTANEQEMAEFIAACSGTKSIVGTSYAPSTYTETMRTEQSEFWSFSTAKTIRRPLVDLGRLTVQNSIQNKQPSRTVADKTMVGYRDRKPSTVRDDRSEAAKPRRVTRFDQPIRPQKPSTTSCNRDSDNFDLPTIAEANSNGSGTIVYNPVPSSHGDPTMKPVNLFGSMLDRLRSLGHDKDPKTQGLVSNISSALADLRDYDSGTFLQVIRSLQQADLQAQDTLELEMEESCDRVMDVLGPQDNISQILLLQCAQSLYSRWKT